MTTATHSEREEFVFELSRYAPKAQPFHAQRLMRYATTYWQLSEKQRANLLSMTDRERNKLLRIKAATTLICRDLDALPVFGDCLNISIDTGNWQKIVRVPCI
jgi:hypothetical protein